VFLEYYHACSGHLEEADSFLNSIRLQKTFVQKNILIKRGKKPVL